MDIRGLDSDQIILIRQAAKKTVPDWFRNLNLIIPQYLIILSWKDIKVKTSIYHPTCGKQCAN